MKFLASGILGATTAQLKLSFQKSFDSYIRDKKHINALKIGFFMVMMSSFGKLLHFIIMGIRCYEAKQTDVHVVWLLIQVRAVVTGAHLCATWIGTVYINQLKKITQARQNNQESLDTYYKCFLADSAFVCLLVCLLGNLFSIPEKSNNFLRWLQSLAAYSRNTRKRGSYHPWLVSNIVTTQFTREKGGCSRNKFL